MSLTPIPVPPTVEWLEHIEEALAALDDCSLAMMGITAIYNRTDENHTFYDEKVADAVDVDSLLKRKQVLGQRLKSLSDDVWLAARGGYEVREVTVLVTSLAQLIRATVKRFEQQAAA